MAEIIIGTRGSKLAVAQSRLVAGSLAEKFPEHDFELKEIVTTGDRILDKKLSEIGGKGLFIKEIEVALLNKEIDLAIHSLKDMPAQLVSGLEIVAIPTRANPLDALISQDDLKLDELPLGAKIGTGSLRRKAQLLNYRSDLKVEAIRGNIDTRLKKLIEEDLDGIILAVAGLERMGWADKISEALSPKISIPAAGQGALAIETRADDQLIQDIVEEINDRDTVDAVKAERSFLEYLDGSCKVPIGAYAQIKQEEIIIEGMVANLDGTRLIRERLSGARANAKELGIQLAKSLERRGAMEILADVLRD